MIPPVTEIVSHPLTDSAKVVRFLPLLLDVYKPLSAVLYQDSTVILES